MRLARIAFVAGLLALTGCAPEGIPWQSERHWSLKEGFYYTWTREIESGCASWMAMEEWVRVRVFMNLSCDAVRDVSYSSPRGFDYSSTKDVVVLYGYWSWDADIFYDRIVFDEEGMIVETLPCPKTLSDHDAAALKAAVIELLDQELTPRERRVVARIDQRFAVFDTHALSSSQFGCSDRPYDPEKKAALGDVNPWAEPMAP